MDLNLINKAVEEEASKGINSLAFPGNAGSVVVHNEQTGEDKYTVVLARGLTKLEWMKGQVAAGLMGHPGAEGDMGEIAWEIHLMAELLLDPVRSKKEWEEAQIKKAKDKEELEKDEKPGWAK